MTHRLLMVAAIAATAVLVSLPTPAAATGPDGMVAAPPVDGQAANPNVGIDEKLGAQVPLDIVFRDESEQPVTLRQCMQGKVTILVPVYYRCPMLCTKVLNGLTDALRALPPDFSVGGKFNVVTVSMDYREHADTGAPKKKAYLAEYGRDGAEGGWRFLTGKKDVLAELLGSVGYRYEYDRAFKEYNHPSGIIILTPEGKVARYFYGIGFDGEYRVPGGTTTLRLSLVEASDGKIGSLTDKLMLECYRFSDGKGYGLHIMRLMKVAGVVTLLALGSWLMLTLRKERRTTAAAGVGHPDAANLKTNGQPEGTV